MSIAIRKIIKWHNNIPLNTYINEILFSVTNNTTDIGRFDKSLLFCDTLVSTKCCQIMAIAALSIAL